MVIAGTGTLATCASLYGPTSVFQYKHEIYIVDSLNNRIRIVDRNGIISTITGTGERGYNGDDILAIDAMIYYPAEIFVHNDQIYFSDRCNHLIRKILPNGIIKTIAGIAGDEGGYNGDDMLATTSKLKEPIGIFIDTSSQVYIIDSGNHCIRMIDQNGMIRTIVGTPCKDGYSGDVPFDFQKYPHIGPPRKKQSIKPFPHAYHDLIVKCEEQD